jgi:hypothetical protein
VEARPATTDYLFIMSDGSGNIEKDVTALGESIDRGLGVTKNDGSGTPNADQRNIRGVTSNAGEELGGNISYSHSHDGPRQDGDFGRRFEPPTGISEINNNNPAPSSTNASIPSVKLLVLTTLTRFGIPQDGFSGKLFLYQGSMDDLDNSWELVTSYDGHFIRGTSTDSEAGSTDDSTTSLPDAESHGHGLQDTASEPGSFNNINDVSPETDTFLEEVGEPDRTALKLVRRT